MSDLKTEAARLGIDDTAIPDDIIPVPAGGITITKTADIVFQLAGERKRMFMRGGVVHEVRNIGDDVLVPVTPERFCTIVEKLGRRVARRETTAAKDGTVHTVWRSTTFPKSTAPQVLAADEARVHLPHIRFLSNCPILTPNGEVLTKGYHDFNGGTFISGGSMPIDVELPAAVEALRDILQDFDFATGGDASRAVASLISPALKMGGHILDDFPLDLAEADQSQSGKTFRQKLVCAIYREQPSTITKANGGVGSMDEAVATAMVRGRPFINIGNFRGTLASEIMEEALRGNRFVQCRTIGRSTEVDTSAFLWQLSTNGAELTRDMANRSIITRIRKRADGYEYRRFLEGDLYAHIVARQPAYLGAVFAVLRAWMDAGCPATNESRHDFRGWVRVLDWIVQNIFGFPPLLDGHREEQLRTANPKLQWLRAVVVAIVNEKHDGRDLTASDIADIADEHDLPPPGRKDSTEAASMRVGRVLAHIFREAGDDKVVVDGHQFIRRIENKWDPFKRMHREEKTYTIEKP